MNDIRAHRLGRLLGCAHCEIAARLCWAQRRAKAGCAAKCGATSDADGLRRRELESHHGCECSAD